MKTVKTIGASLVFMALVPFVLLGVLAGLIANSVCFGYWCGTRLLDNIFKNL